MSRTISALIASNRFFYATIVLFVVGSAWVATASLYPMAFDEGFHFGLIQIYSTHLSPYTIEPTSDMAQYGLVSADVSYLFHYLMSFPYRVINVFNVSEQTMVVLLRFINIGFVVWALFIYRKILYELGLSKVVSHSALALFTLVPIMPLLAGQINYDNMLLVVIGWSLLFAIRIDKLLREKNELDVSSLGWLMILVLFGSNIKYAFLPIGAMLLIWLGGHALYRYKFKIRNISKHLLSGWRAVKPSNKQLLIALAIVGLLLSGRFVTNVIEYGQFIPKCQAVFDYDACQAYGPWARNERMHSDLASDFVPKSVPEYIVIDWLPGMVRRLFFAIAGPTNDYANAFPLLAPMITYIILLLVGLGSLLYKLKTVFKRYPALLLVSAVTLAYILSLIYKLYSVYQYTGGPVAINGRYLLPFVPLIAGVLGSATVIALRGKILSSFYVIIAASLAVILTQGGGIGTYILQAQPDWFWPGWGEASHTLLQNIVSLLII